MNKLKLFYMLLLEMVLLFVWVFLGNVGDSDFISDLLIPISFAKISLNTLADSGDVGNGIAFAVIVLFSSLPLLIGVLFKKIREDKVLLFSLVGFSVISMLAFFILLRYDLFCEPSLIGVDKTIEFFEGSTEVLLLSLFVTLIVIFILRQLRKKDSSSILSYGNAMIFLLCFIIAFTTIKPIFSSLKMLFDTPYFYYHYNFIIDTVLKVVANIPRIFCIIVLAELSNLISAFKTDARTAVVFVGKAYTKAKTYLLVLVCTEVFLNIMNLVVFDFIVNRKISLDLSTTIYSICLILIIMMVLKIIEKNNQLKSENDLFI